MSNSLIEWISSGKRWLLGVIGMASVLLIWFALTAGAAQLRNQKQIKSLRVGEAAEGSRVTVVSDSALSDYEAFRRGDRFYVKIPAADIASGQRLLRGTGFDDGQVQKVGDSTIISFRLQPGTTARVDQRSNRLDVVFSTVGKPQNAAAASVSMTSALRRGFGPESRSVTERLDSSSVKAAGTTSGQNNVGSQLTSSLKSGSGATPTASSSSASPTSANVGSSLGVAGSGAASSVSPRSSAQRTSRSGVVELLGALLLVSLALMLATRLHFRRASLF